jgi:hypothetical protein
MLDVTSRQIVADRVIEDRHAEARRAHLLRAERTEAPAFMSGGRVVAGPGLLDRVLAAVRHLSAPVSAPARGRPAYR